MTQPIKSCRLFFYLRQKAYVDSDPTPEWDQATRGVIRFDSDDCRQNGLELSEIEVERALSDLLETSLVRRLTDDEAASCAMGPRPGSAEPLFVEAIDDLMAATILFGEG